MNRDAIAGSETLLVTLLAWRNVLEKFAVTVGSVASPSMPVKLNADDPRPVASRLNLAITKFPDAGARKSENRKPSPKLSGVIPKPSNTPA